MSLMRMGVFSLEEVNRLFCRLLFPSFAFMKWMNYKTCMYWFSSESNSFFKEEAGFL